MSNPVRLILIAAVFLIFGTMVSFAQCKEISADIKVVKETTATGPSQSIVVEFKGSEARSVELNLFGPERNNILHSDKTEFKNLSNGNYIVVIVGKREQDNYCPMSKNVTIN